MALVNASTLVALQKSFQVLFQTTLDSTQPAWPRPAMESPSENAEENYQWLGRVPAMKEWLGSKTVEQLRGMSYLILNRDWESTIGVKRNHIEDDMLGMYRPRIAELASEGARHPDDLLSTVRVAGNTATGLCYDGQQFYDMDHAEGDSGTQSNKLTGTGTTAAQVRADLFAAKAALRKFKDDRGKPYIRKMGTLDVIAVIPPDLEKTFDELNNPALGSTTPKTPIDYEVDPYLTDVNDWYLDYVGGPVKPFIMQMRRRPILVALEDPNSSESVFLRQEFLYSVEARYNVGYGLWEYSILTTNT